MKKSFTIGLILTLSSALLISCAPKKKVKKPLPELEEQTAQEEELDIRGSEFVASKNLRNIYFEFDQSSLTSQARGILQENAEFLKSNRDFEVLVEGHCDERGTTEYNLGLGQKRAKTVRNYYVRLGIQGSRVGTISYGEEKTVCAQSAEDCWAQNRRAQTLVRAPAESRAPAAP
ncbi:MAG: peptidoglycan-associated lipoprotein Pal [Elusimicrobia bacterium]|nr:peptidoglycan-associated lipoprotein Pal [Elusimicrobiota bacterium]